MQKELSVIIQLPFEKDLINLYRVFEANLLLAKDELVYAEECLNNLSASLTKEEALQETSLEILYHYYFNKGSLNLLRNKSKTALGFYLKALSLIDVAVYKEDGLHFNIAYCYSNLALPHKAIHYA